MLWGEVHQDSQHVAGAFWEARQNVFQGTDNGDTFDAAFYAMLVSISPNADFGLVAASMAARVATAFPGIPTASAQMTTIFQGRGVIGCSKVLTAPPSAFPRPYYGISAAPASLPNAVIPGPIQFKLRAAAGALRVRLSGNASSGGALGMGAPPVVRILTRNAGPITFVRQGGTLQNNADLTVNAVVNGNAVTGSADVNAPCNTDVYVTLASPGTGATLQNITFTVDPLVNCMIPVDAGTGGGTGNDAGTGGGGGNTGTTTLPAVGPSSTTQQASAKVGCGCASPADFAAPLLGLMLLVGSRRRRS